VIVSLAEQEPVLRSFRMRNGEVSREEIEIVNALPEVSDVV
jgi:hypothetical protein